MAAVAPDQSAIREGNRCYVSPPAYNATYAGAWIGNAFNAVKNDWATSLAQMFIGEGILFSISAFRTGLAAAWASFSLGTLGTAALVTLGVSFAWTLVWSNLKPSQAAVLYMMGCQAGDKVSFQYYFQ